MDCAVRTFDVVDAGQGVLGSSDKLTANLTILASDDPYGVFIVSANGRPVVTQSADTGTSTSFFNPFNDVCIYSVVCLF